MLAGPVLAAADGRLGAPRLRARPRGKRALAGLRQSGAARVRFPKPAAGDAPEAVLLNTAGGLTGGDRIDVEVALAAGCAPPSPPPPPRRSTARSRRRRDPGAPRPRTTARASPGCRSRPSCSTGRGSTGAPRWPWPAMPRFLAVEMLIFGRAAMGEDVHRGACRDAWRVRRDGRLVFADTFRVDGPSPTSWTAAPRSTAPAPSAMLLYAAPDAAARLDEVRALLARCAERGGRQHLERPAGRARRGARRPHAAASDLEPLIARARSGRPLPRVWHAECEEADDVVGRPGGSTPAMNLTAREKDKLLISMAAIVARRRLERGVKLNHPEAIALISDFVVEGARDGRSVADLMEAGAQVVTPRPGDGGHRRNDPRRAGGGDLPRRGQARHRAQADPIGRMSTPTGAAP